MNEEENVINECVRYSHTFNLSHQEYYNKLKNLLDIETAIKNIIDEMYVLVINNDENRFNKISSLNNELFSLTVIRKIRNELISNYYKKQSINDNVME